MYYMFMTLNLMMTIIFLFLNHPMSMGLILLIQTILISLISGMFSYSYWFSYILFLVMVGGMLVLFIYMTSLASNEMFYFSSKLMYFMLMFFLLMLYMFMMSDYMMISAILKNSNLIEMTNNMMFLKNENMFSLNQMYNHPNNLLTIMLMNYLFLTMIAIVKITNINYGPLRQKF
uniref:NADH-ubiquinone oxidoreductase chain 6 n=1 Tax=Nebria brevicollis TaxID=110024 RepID=A0A191ZRS3_NEBBR|nr:NADH dehydrogenase subunit 6 [Nebria brevicollis]